MIKELNRYLSLLLVLLLIVSTIGASPIFALSDTISKAVSTDESQNDETGVIQSFAGNSESDPGENDGNNAESQNTESDRQSENDINADSAENNGITQMLRNDSEVVINGDESPLNSNDASLYDSINESTHVSGSDPASVSSDQLSVSETDVSSGQAQISVSGVQDDSDSLVPLSSEPDKAGDFYLLSSLDDLVWFRDEVNSGKPELNARLTSDIDLSEVCGENTGESWTPICPSTDVKYKGTFDGDYNTISGLYISEVNINYQGLFGIIDGGKVENLRLDGSVTADVSAGSSTYTGGIAGLLNSGTIENCMNTTDVTGYLYVGGIVGGIVMNEKNTTASIISSVNTGEVKTVHKSRGKTGGIAGYTESKNLSNANISIYGCANRGDVKGNGGLGGLIGSDYSGKSTSQLSITNCYTSGSVDNNNNSGAIIGTFEYNYGTVSNSYYLLSSNNYPMANNSINKKKSLVNQWKKDFGITEEQMLSSEFVSRLGGETAGFNECCGEYPALGWEHEVRVVKAHTYISEVLDATCTKGGFTMHECSQCGLSYISDETSPAGHSFDSDHVCTICGSLEEYSVTFELEHITKTSGNVSAPFGCDYHAVIEPEAYIAPGIDPEYETGYHLPKHIAVTVAGVACSGYSYDSDTGEITIPGSNVTGNIEIAALGDVRYYCVDFYENDMKTVYKHYFVPFGTIISYAEGYDILAEKPETEDDECYSYEFAGWTFERGSQHITFSANRRTVDQDIAFYPEYNKTPKSYSVTYAAVSAELSLTDEIVTAEYGTDLEIAFETGGIFDASQVYASVICSGSALFAGTDYSIDTEKSALVINGDVIRGNLTVNLSIRYRYFNMRFYDADGSLISNSQYLVKQGDAVTAPSNSEQDYTDESGNLFVFEGWSDSPDGSIVDLPVRASSSGSYYAVYSCDTIVHSIYFYDYDGITALNLSKTGYSHREQLEVPENYTESWSDDTYVYTFSGWSATAGGSICALPVIVTSDSSFYAVYSRELKCYDVRFYIDNASFIGKASVSAISDYTVNLKGNEGFTTPEEVSVSVGGIAYSGFEYDSDSGNLSIPADDITGIIEIAASGVPRTLDVEFNLKNMAVSEGALSVSYGAVYTAIFTPDDGYSLQGGTVLTAGGRALEQRTDYTYEILTVYIENTENTENNADDPETAAEDSKVASGSETAGKYVRFARLTVLAQHVTDNLKFTAYAAKTDESGTVTHSGDVILSDTIIEKGGTYYAAPDTKGVIRIETTEHVKITGLGMSPVTSVSNYVIGSEALSIVCAKAGASLEIENLAITGSASAGYNIIDFTGSSNSLIVSGQNLITNYRMVMNYNKAAIHAAEGNSLTIGGSGTLCFGVGGEGAGIGGDEAEACGDITIENGDLRGFIIPEYNNTVIIGSGYGSASMSGTVRINGGSVSLIQTGLYNNLKSEYGAIIGDNNGLADFEMNGGDLYLLVRDLSAPVRADTITINGGSVRVFNDSLGENCGAAGLDKYTDSITDDNGEKLYCLKVDTSGIPAEADGSYNIVLNGLNDLNDLNSRFVYSGYTHRNVINRESDTDAGYVAAPSYGMWTQGTDTNIYLYLKPGDYSLDTPCGTRSYYWDADKQSFTEEMHYSIIDGSSDVDFSVSKKSAALGDTVNVSVLPDSDVIVSNVGYYCGDPAYTVYPELSDGSFSFEMPAGAVTLVADTDYAAGYALTMSDCVNGSVSVKKCLKSDGLTVRKETTEAKPGDIVYLEVKGDDGYGPRNVWFVYDSDRNHAERIKKGDDGEYSFVMPEENVTVCASFTETAEISVNKTGEGAVVYYEVPAGDNAEFTLNPSDGWGLVSVRVTDLDGGEIELTKKTDYDGSVIYSFVMPDPSAVINAVFGRVFSVNIDVKNRQRTGLDEATSFLSAAESAPAGSIVRVDAKVIEPDDHVDEISAVCIGKDGEEIEISCTLAGITAEENTYSGIWAANNDEYYEFVMPEADVTVSAEFRAYSITLDTAGEDEGFGATDLADKGEYVRGGRSFAVYLTVQPDCEAAVPKLEYTDADGNVNILESQSSRLVCLTGGVDRYIYTYIMPESDVTVHTEYVMKNARTISLVKTGETGGILKTDSIVADSGLVRAAEDKALSGDTVYVKAEEPLGSIGLSGIFYTIEGEAESETEEENESELNQAASEAGTTGSSVTTVSPGAVSGQPRHSLNAVGGGLYSFEMPDADVTVYAEFSEKHKLILDKIYRLGTGTVYFPKESWQTDCWAFPGDTVTVTGAGIEGYRFVGLVYKPQPDETVTNPAVVSIPSRAVTVTEGGIEKKVYVADVEIADEDMILDAYFMPVYTVAVGEGPENGRLLTSVSEAVQGETITVTPEAISSYFKVSHVYYSTGSAVSEDAPSSEDNAAGADIGALDAGAGGAGGEGSTGGEGGADSVTDAESDADTEISGGSALNITELLPDEDGVYKMSMPASDLYFYTEFAPVEIERKASISVIEDQEKTVAGRSFSSNGQGAVRVDDSAAAGENVTVTVTPKSGSYTGYGAVKYIWEEYGEVKTGFAVNTSDEGWCTSGSGGTSYTYEFTMPETDHVDILTRFTSEDVWDGVTIDVSWYDEENSYFEIDTPAKLMGASALVNGIYNEEIDTVIGDITQIKAVKGDEALDDEVDDNGLPTQNRMSTTEYYLGEVDFGGCTLSITKDLDMGGKGSGSVWTGARFMPIGGQYIMYYTDYDFCKTDGLSHLNSAFNGVLDGGGHSLENVYCNRYVYGSNYGDSQSIGIVGRLGSHELSDDTLASVNPTVRNLIVESGFIKGRRSVGGIVGKIGQSTADKENDGTVGCIIENCVNKADISASDKKGTGGIVGASWYAGFVRNCANLGNVKNTLSEGTPVGGISGLNRIKLVNSYNVGYISAEDDACSMGIGTRELGEGEAENCWYVSSQSAGGGYMRSIYDGADNTNGISDSEMRSASMAEKLNTAGDVWVTGKSKNDGYPVLWFQSGGSLSNVSVNITQPVSGGAFTAYRIYGEESALRNGTNSIENGSTLKLTANPAVGMVLDYYTLNGKKIEGNYVSVVGGGTVSAVFRELKSIRLYLPEDITSITSQGLFNAKDYYMTIVKDGVAVGSDGIASSITDYTVGLNDSGEEADGRKYITIFEGDNLEFTAKLREGASPVEAGKTYGGFNFFITEFGADGSQLRYGAFTVNGYVVPADTVTGKLDVIISVTADSWEDIADISWFTGDRETYIITTPQELAGLALIVNGKASSMGIEARDFKEITVKLGNDISLANPDGSLLPCRWASIGNGKTGAVDFAGTFDGCGFTVSNMYISSYDSGIAALFGELKGKVKNLTVGGTVAVDTNKAVAGLVGRLAGGKVTDCINKASVSGGQGSGGIAAQLISGSVSGCVNEGAVSSGESDIGGVIGTISLEGGSSVSVTGCSNTGAVNGYSNIGGIVGSVSRSLKFGDGSLEFTCSDCTNSGTVTSRGSNAGGIAGKIDGAAVMLNCKNLESGTVQGMDNSECIAGIAGTVSGEGRVTDCENLGKVSGEHGSRYVAGIAGRLSGGTLSGCSNSGVVKGSGAHTAGIVALAAKENSKINDCKNLSSIFGGGDCTGGIAGELLNAAVMNSCENYGHVEGIYTPLDGAQIKGMYTGGIAGKVSGAVMKSCKNAASASIQGGTGFAGGVIGGVEMNVNAGTSKRFEAESCSNSGSVTGGANDYTGGITGGILCTGGGTGTVSFGRCTNSGNVSASGSYTGGISGGVLMSQTTGETTVTFTGCANNGIVRGTLHTGGIAGSVFDGELDSDHSVKLNSCKNDGQVSGTMYVGGVSGSLEGGMPVITGCKNNESVSGTGYVGGSVGRLLIESRNYNKTFSITNTYNYGTVKGSTGSVGIGGIAGAVEMETSASGRRTSINVADCWNNGDVSGGESVGGVVGKTDQEVKDIERNVNLNLTVSKSGNGTGSTVVSNGDYAGGFAGYINASSMNGSECYNKGSVKACGSYAGGIAGYLTGGSCRLTDCVNDEGASVEAVGGVAGGIVGQSAGGVIEKCVNYAMVKAAYRAGGVAGYISGSGTVRFCGNEREASVIGGSSCGGVAGETEADIIGCYNRGSISGGEGIAGRTASGVNISFCYNSSGEAAGLNGASSALINNAYSRLGGITNTANSVFGENYVSEMGSDPEFVNLLNSGGIADTSFIALSGTYNDDLPVLEWEKFDYSVTVYSEYGGDVIAEDSVQRGGSYSLSTLREPHKESVIDGYTFEFVGWRCDEHLYDSDDTISNIRKATFIYAEFEEVKIDPGEIEGEEPGSGDGGDPDGNPFAAPSDDGQEDRDPENGSQPNTPGQNRPDSGSDTQNSGSTSVPGANAGGGESGGGNNPGNSGEGSSDIDGVNGTGIGSTDSVAEEDIISVGDSETSEEIVSSGMVALVETPQPVMEQMQEAVSDMNAYFLNTLKDDTNGTVEDSPMLMIIRLIMLGLIVIGMVGRLTKFYGFDMPRKKRQRGKR